MGPCFGKSLPKSCLPQTASVLWSNAPWCMMTGSSQEWRVSGWDGTDLDFTRDTGASNRSFSFRNEEQPVIGKIYFAGLCSLLLCTKSSDTYLEINLF